MPAAFLRLTPFLWLTPFQVSMASPFLCATHVSMFNFVEGFAVLCLRRLANAELKVNFVEGFAVQVSDSKFNVQRFNVQKKEYHPEPHPELRLLSLWLLSAVEVSKYRRAGSDSFFVSSLTSLRASPFKG